MSKELIKVLNKVLEEALAELRKNDTPSDQHLLDDGWIRHTGDVCPVHELDEGRILMTSGETRLLHDVWMWRQSVLNKVTHYKVTKKYDPHAENKSLYAKKLVDWSCHLLKGVNTNFGEWLYARRVYVITINQGGEVQHPATEDLRIAHTDATPSNWQAYNGEDLNLLHEAGFVVKLRKCNGVSIYEDGSAVSKPLFGTSPEVTVHYLVIGIRDGFTDDPASGVDVGANMRGEVC